MLFHLSQRYFYFLEVKFVNITCIESLKEFFIQKSVVTAGQIPDTVEKSTF